MPMESILGFDLFSWETWEQFDEDILTFLNVTFIPVSLKKFNGSNVDMSRNGDVVVYNGNNQSHKIDLFTVPEFVSYVTNRIKIK